MRLLGEKDLGIIRAAVGTSTGIVLERSYPGRLWTRVSVVPCREPWETDRLIRVEVQRGPVYSTQYCVSVEEVRQLGY